MIFKLVFINFKFITFYLSLVNLLTEQSVKVATEYPIYRIQVNWYANLMWWSILWEFVNTIYGRNKRTTERAAQQKSMMVKLLRAHGGCLGTRSRWRTWRTTKLPRGAVSKLWSGGVRMGKPGCGNTQSLISEYIGNVETDQGNWNI